MGSCYNSAMSAAARARPVSTPPQPTPANALAKPVRRRYPPRLASYTLPDFEAVDLQIQAGSTVAAAWRRYAEGAHRPIKFQAFALRYRGWLRDRKPQPDMVPGIPNYTSAENIAADEFWSNRSDPTSSILTLTGFGCSLSVRDGFLIAFDTGVTRKYEPTGHCISAVVFGAFGGVISTGAIQWCAIRDIPIITLDYHGNLISVSAALSPNNINTRRAQFAADPLMVARVILLQKIAGGRRIGRIAEITHARVANQIRNAPDIPNLLQIEAQTALGYWGAWRFPLKHHSRSWPISWQQFDGRTSMISHGPEHATHPVNAILNFVYSITAGLCVRSLIAAGFDPCIGLLHQDREGRYSLAYDLLELLRADIDNSILPWVASQKWRRADFPVTSTSVVRLHPSLTRVAMQKAAAAVTPDTVDKAAAWLAGGGGGGCGSGAVGRWHGGGHSGVAAGLSRGRGSRDMPSGLTRGCSIRRRRICPRA